MSKLLSLAILLSGCIPPAGAGALPSGSYHEIPKTAPREEKLGVLPAEIKDKPMFVLRSHDVEDIPTTIVAVDKPVALKDHPGLGTLPVGSRIGYYNNSIEWIALGDAATVYGKQLPAHSLLAVNEYGE